MEFWENLKKVIGQSAYYIVFSVLLFVALLLITSIVAFFHFTLDHDFLTIESWITSNIWEMVIIAKLISLYLFYLIFISQKTRFSLNQEFYGIDVNPPRVDDFVVIVFLLISTIVISKPQINEEFSLAYSIISYFFHFLLFATSLFVHCLILKSSLINSLFERFTFSAIAAILFVVNLKLASPGVKIYKGLFGLEYFLLIWIFSKDQSWLRIICHLTLFVIPVNIVLGYDVFLGSQYSIYSPYSPIDFLSALFLYSVCVSYLIIKDRQRLSVNLL